MKTRVVSRVQKLAWHGYIAAAMSRSLWSIPPNTILDPLPKPKLRYPGNDPENGPATWHYHNGDLWLIPDDRAFRDCRPEFQIASYAHLETAYRDHDGSEPWIITNDRGYTFITVLSRFGGDLAIAGDDECERAAREFQIWLWTLYPDQQHLFTVLP